MLSLFCCVIMGLHFVVDVEVPLKSQNKHEQLVIMTCKMRGFSRIQCNYVKSLNTDGHFLCCHFFVYTLISEFNFIFEIKNTL